jgi:transposase
MTSTFPEHVSSVSPLDGGAIDGSPRPKPQREQRAKPQEFPVTVTWRHPAGKRLTETQERRGREMFEQGRSERHVAKKLQVSPSTAHRLKERAGLVSVPDLEQESLSLAELRQLRVSALAQLARIDRRIELGEIAEALEAHRLVAPEAAWLLAQHESYLAALESRWQELEAALNAEEAESA